MLLFEGTLTEKELNTAMMSMDQVKAPWNDGLTKEFHSSFGKNWKNLLLPFGIYFISKTSCYQISTEKKIKIKDLLETGIWFLS